jgi:hypothetical protein
MSPRSHARRRSRQALLWRVFYGTEELIGQGSIVDVHETGCRIVGCMPVEAGMHVRICMWPTENLGGILAARGCVKWAKGLEFGVLFDGPVPNFEDLLPKPAGESQITA